MHLRTLPMLALALSLGVTACVDDPVNVVDTAPLTARSDAPLVPAFGLDAHYARIAVQVPGFGGAYRDESGRIVAHVAGRDLATDGATIRGELAALLVRGGAPKAPGVAADPAAGTQIILREGTFDYGQLVEFRDRAGAAFAVPGAVFTDIDEKSNRVVIGIEEGASEAGFRAALSGAGVPDEAVTFAVTEPVVPLSGETLRSRVQPLGGGLQLVFPHPVPGYVSLCTLGFNVAGMEPGYSGTYFITNSHCSLDQGTTDGTPYHQQPIAYPNPRYRVALEVADPAYQPCYGGLYVCRYADAAMARYETDRTPVKLDAIYRTEAVNSGSLRIPTTEEQTFFRVTAEIPYAELGDVLSKVGRTTGWTEGPVFATCRNVLQSGSNRVILCQDYVAADVAGGDSGSPVFMRHGDSNDVTLAGVLWGGGPGRFVMSPMLNIRYELPPFRLF